MKVLYLFNKVLGEKIKDVKNSVGHDSWLFGMNRLQKHGIETDFLELEKFIPRKISRILRKYILTMHYAHLPLFPLFFKYDLVFTSTAYSSLILKALLGIKSFKWVILDFNLVSTIGERKTVKQKIFHWAVGKSDGIVAISAAEVDALKTLYPHLASKIIFLHEATDVDFFSPDPFVHKKNQIICVGNYGRDFETPINAVRDLNVDLVIATKLVNDKSRSLLPKNVRTKYLNENELLAAYRESSIAIVSIEKKDDYFDSVGTLSLGEAFSMALPTIATKMKSMDSYLNDGNNGIFVGQHDVRAMKSAIISLLNNPEKRDMLGRNAREFALKYLDPEVFALNLAVFLKKI